MPTFLKKPSKARNTLLFASATHVWSDLAYAITVPLLPLIQSDPKLLLTYTQVGLLRSVFNGASAVLQIPAGYLAEQLGEFWLLIGGNIWVAAGIIGMTAASSYFALLLITLIGGLGGSTQHPLATSMVSRSYDDAGRSMAVGTVNFAGDLGKLAAPVLAMLLAVKYGWRFTMRVVGVGGLIFMLLATFVRGSLNLSRHVTNISKSDSKNIGITHLHAFIILNIIGFLDSGTRGAALTFLPFIMKNKSLGDEQIFVMLLFLLSGGAAGKFICGWLNERYGSVSLIWGTKAMTVALLIATLATPTNWLAPLMLLLGIGLNGTSSILYSSVSAFIPAARRTRGYGYFYTTTEIGGTVAPIFYGRLADLFGLRLAMLVMGAITALILPISLALHSPLKEYSNTENRKSAH